LSELRWKDRCGSGVVCQIDSGYLMVQVWLYPSRKDIFRFLGFFLNFQDGRTRNSGKKRGLSQKGIFSKGEFSELSLNFDGKSGRLGRLLLKRKHVKKSDNWYRGSYSDSFLLNRIHHQTLGFTGHSKSTKSRVWYGSSSWHAKITTNIKIETSIDFFETGVSCRSLRFEDGVSRRSTFLRDNDSLCRLRRIDDSHRTMPGVRIGTLSNDAVKFQLNEPQPSWRVGASFRTLSTSVSTIHTLNERCHGTRGQVSSEMSRDQWLWQSLTFLLPDQVTFVAGWHLSAMRQ
jgi:hypothetical protein